MFSRTMGFRECSNPKSTFLENSFSKNLFSRKKACMFFLPFSNSTTKSMSLEIFCEWLTKLPKSPKRVTPKVSRRTFLFVRRYAMISFVSFITAVLSRILVCSKIWCKRTPFTEGNEGNKGFLQMVFEFMYFQASSSGYSTHGEGVFTEGNKGH